MSRTDRLEAGTIVLADLEPVRGSEQKGTRPVLVISVGEINERSSRVIVCPITSNTQPWPTKVALPPSCRTKGMVLTDQLRSIDSASRVLRVIEATPPRFLALVRSHVGRLIGLVLPEERG